MKKLNAEFFLQLTFGVASISLMIGGIVMIVASFFYPLSTINSVIITASGAILYTGVRIYFMLLEINDYVKDIPPQTGNNKFTPDLLKPDEVIRINEDITPEQLEEIKKNFPMIADQLDYIVDGFNDFHKKSVKSIHKMSIQQLKEELQKAVDNNEFEKAAEIRDVLKKKNS